jgi:hypothetical protein
MSKKKRVELQIDKEKDHDVVNFLENNVDNQAGFIKNLLRQYVRGELIINNAPSPSVSSSFSPKELEAPTNTSSSKSSNERKKIPASALTGMSSRDLK